MAYRAVQHNGNNLFGFSILTVSSSSSSLFVVAAVVADASRFQWPFVDWLRIPRISNCPVGLCVYVHTYVPHTTHLMPPVLLLMYVREMKQQHKILRNERNFVVLTLQLCVRV